MSLRRVLAALGAAIVVLALQTTPSYAAVTDVYVATAALGGDDSNPCTDVSPCVTVQHAVDAADATGTTVHVGAGTFDGLVVSAKNVTIEGAGSDQTTVTDTADSAYRVVEVGSGTTTLSGLTVHGALAIPVLVYGTGHVVTQNVVLDGGACSLTVLAGQADLTDSVVQNAGQSGCDLGTGSTPLAGDIGMVTGNVTLVRSKVLSPNPNQPGVRMAGGTFSADQTVFDDTAHQSVDNDSTALDIKGGTAEVSRSTFRAFGTGVLAYGGVATVSDSTFFDNVAGVTSLGGTALVLRSTFEGQLGSLLSNGAGTVSVAGSVLGTDSIANCSGPVTDLGYNLATDDSCSFTGTSHDRVTGLNLDTDLADQGGPVQTVAILDPSRAVDAIPAGATYGSPASTLCPATGATDLRGVPRPVGGACDAGSMEMARTTTALSAPKSSKPHHDVALTATLETPDVGVEGLEFPVGTVTFRAGSQVLCSGGFIHHGEVQCATTDLAAGRHHLTATFVPAADSTLHASTSPARLIVVGTTPKVTAPRRVVVHVGRKSTITVRSTGSPTPRLEVVKGKVPKGMKVTKKAGVLTISGTPKVTSLGRRTLTVKTTNATGSATRMLTIVVKRA